MAETRLMYMHTLDNEPANYTNADGRPHMYFVGHGRTPVQLVPTLRQIRREQQSAIATAWAEKRALPGESRRYGYRLVAVPAAASPEGR